MSPKDKIKIFNSNIAYLFADYDSLIPSLASHVFTKMFQKRLRTTVNQDTLVNLGYSAFEGSLKGPLDFGTDPEETSHSWYKNINIHGVRWNIFKKTLKDMSRSKCTFILYQPPVSDMFRQYVKNSAIEKSELEYSQMIRDEVKVYGNIHFIDCFSKNPESLSNVDYYDAQHLNAPGAKKFTLYLMQDCLDKKYIAPSRLR